MTAFSGSYCDRWRDLLPVHALGNPIEDSGGLREHLDGCAACRRELQELEEAFSLLPHALPKVAPPAAARERLLRQVRDEALGGPQAPIIPLHGARSRTTTGGGTSSHGSAHHPPPAPARSRGAGLYLLLVASLCATVGLSAQLLRERRRYHEAERQRAALSQRLQEASTTAQDEGTRLKETQEALTFLNARKVQLVSLQPPSGESDDSQQPIGHILWDHDHHSWLFFAAQLPPPPPDKDYQLWFMIKGPDGNQPVSAGLVRTLPSGELLAQVQVPAELADISAAALTLEQKGGAERPTSEPLLVGQI